MPIIRKPEAGIEPAYQGWATLRFTINLLRHKLLSQPELNRLGSGANPVQVSRLAPRRFRESDATTSDFIFYKLFFFQY